MTRFSQIGDRLAQANAAQEFIRDSIAVRIKTELAFSKGRSLDGLIAQIERSKLGFFDSSPDSVTLKMIGVTGSGPSAHAALNAWADAVLNDSEHTDDTP